MNKKFAITFVFVLIGIAIIVFFFQEKGMVQTATRTIRSAVTITPREKLNPLTIQAMRERSYLGSDIKIEKILPSGSNYDQYIVSYMSDGLKIYGLLAVPQGDKPATGWPVILFNHGYIPPKQYQTNPFVGQYVTYFPVFAQQGYIVFKPDYRGNGNSQGQPEGAYYSPAYAIDDLNALASIKKYKDADPNRIGIWGHSMGGNITLRDLVVDTKDIKAAVIWGGVVGSYNDLINNWQHNVSYVPSQYELGLRNRYRQNLITTYGTPGKNPTFWNSIDPTFFVGSITAPIQLDVGGSDEEVPVSFSLSLKDKLQKAGRIVEYYEYPGDNHNISLHFTEAMQHSLDFFNTYVKGGGK